MTNIIDIYFDSVGSTATAPSKLWQWSKGQIVRINGLDLPTVYQVHFSNNPTLGTAEPVAVSGNMVSIPDIYLTTGEPVYLFIWLSDETSAETIRKGTIYVAKRSQPSGAYDPTAEQQTIIDGLIGSINTAVATAEGYANSAQTYSGNAATSATEALNAKDAAQGYAEQASQTAQGVEILVNRAEDAADDAETAKQDVEQLKQAVEGLADDAESAKTDAETARGEAQGFAQTASTKASEAVQSASQASESAATATAQAQTATAKATEASQSAETATTKASEASASATTATAKASEASTSASTATTAKNDAVTAKNAAVTARTGAETARAGAETAAQSVSASAAQIATNTSDIADLKADLSELEDKIVISFGKNRFSGKNLGIGYYNESGNIVNDDRWTLSDYTNVGGLSNVAFSTSVNGSRSAQTVFFIAGFDTAKQFTSLIVGSAGALTVAIPNDVEYIRFSFRNVVDLQVESGTSFTEYEPYIEYNSLVNSLDTERIEAIEDKFIVGTGKNKYSGTGLENGYYYNASGTLVEDLRWTLSDYTDVNGFNNAVFSATINNARTLTTLFYIAGFTTDKVFVSQLASSGTSVSIPANVAYIRFSFRTAPTDLQIEEGTSYTAYEPYTEYTEIKNAPYLKDVVKPYTSVRWAVFGDSMTEKTAKANFAYYDYVKEDLGCEIVNYGRSGTGYKTTEESNSAFYQRMLTIDPTAFDVLTIFGSVNDAGKTVGNITDTGTETLCGCINTTIDNFYSIAPFKTIGLITPPPTISLNYTAQDTTWIDAYVDAIIGIAKRRSIPVMDMYHESGLRPYNADFRVEYYNENGSQDAGVHPNSKAHEQFLYPKFRQFFKTLI